MIIFKTMRWGNLFSYGDKNEIDFSSSFLTQIIGANGHGKSSIALVLEEVLFNKNSKGTKRSDVINRHGTSKSYWIELDFEKDGALYHIRTVRGSTQTVKLTHNGKDISAHTATSTYKLIEEILGYDHKTFTQIIYQSSANSLEFLTATDGARKKFLIELLNLSRYTDNAEVFKSLVKATSDELAGFVGKISSLDKILTKYSTMSFERLSLVDTLEAPRDLVERISVLKASIEGIDAHNKKVSQNKKYKELLDALDIVPATPRPVISPDLLTSKIEAEKDKRDAEAFVLKMRKLGSKCATCLQDIDSTKLNELVAERDREASAAQSIIKDVTIIISEHEKATTKWLKEEKQRTEYEELHSLYDPSMSTALLDKNEVENEIQSLERKVASINLAIRHATEQNTKATAHNAKIEIIQAEIEEITAELELLRIERDIVTSRLSIQQILVKTFSPTGLVAYKIECLIKDLEDATNEYLIEISDGRFQISFRIAASDKLNVVISDNGTEIEMSALSGGERARVNTATLLGIRKLLQAMSNTRVNLLILDETIENLDTEGKEKLVEILLQEESLNTFIISHGFSHPLLEKLSVVKTSNISRIE
jgi:DNA repair exonuclease SbcCD ATPase subunit